MFWGYYGRGSGDSGCGGVGVVNVVFGMRMGVEVGGVENRVESMVSSGGNVSVAG